MKKINFFMIAVCLASFIGCNEKSDVAVDNKSAAPAKTYNKILFTGYTKYSMFINDADKTIGYVSEKQDALSKSNLSVFGLNELAEKSENTENMSFVKINGTMAEELKTIANSENFNLKNQALFGQDIRFSVGRQHSSTTGRNNTPSKDEETFMYVPDTVKITSPSIQSSSDLLPYCYYKNFKLGWNADPKNENGLVVVVQWTGTDMFGKNRNILVNNLDIIKNDNGECILNDKLFDNIPQGALAKLILLRGNIEMFENYIDEDNTETYKVIAGSLEILPFIMVRDI